MQENFEEAVAYFCSVLARASGSQLCEWGSDTYEEALKWAAYFESMYQRVSETQEQQVQQYLQNAEAWRSLQHPLRAQELWCAKHKLLRALLHNGSAPPALLSRVIRDYQLMGEDAQERQTARLKLVRDLASAVHSRRALQLQLQQGMPRERVPQRFMQEEVDYFRRPDSLRYFSCSRLLLRKASQAPDDKLFAQKLIMCARRAPAMVQMMLLMMVPRGLYLALQEGEEEDVPCSQTLRQALCRQLLSHRVWTALWSQPVYLLTKVAARDEAFREAYLTTLS